MVRANKKNILAFFYFKNVIIYSVVTILLNVSCKKLVEIDPPVTVLSSDVVFSNNASAAAVLTGVYDNMIYGSSKFSSGYYSLSLLAGLSADEFKKYSTDPTQEQFFVNAVSSNRVRFWVELYNYIYTANAVLEAMVASPNISAEVKQQLIGEAKFVRAFCYFYLFNLFGDVPLITTTDYKVNALASRASADQVYSQVIADLKSAKELLNSQYVAADVITTTSDRVRPNKWAATALLARVFLYSKDWANAENEATAVINNTSMYNLDTNLNNVFVKNSIEAIWQLQPVQVGYNTYDAYYFVLTSTPNNAKPVALSTFLVNAFDSADNRKKDWVGTITFGTQTYYYSNKYKISALNQPVSEYLMVLRLAEQHLIRAEARAQQNKTSSSQDDLNIIRARAGLPNTSANDKTSLLTAILHERQVELFSEWGHRWLDLKRTGTVDAVMSIVCPQKGGTWSPNWALYPIPLGEIQNDPNLIQNPGYQ